MASSTAPLVVSIVSAAVTVTGLIWNLALYKLSGARLLVEVVFEFYNEHAQTQSVLGKKRMSWDDFHASHPGNDPTHQGIEAVRVRVTNIGRSPVSVENIALDTGRYSRWRRPGRNSFVPFPFINHDSSDPELQEPSSGPARLEAGEVTSRIFQLWPAVEHLAARSEGELVIRGTATRAGRRPTLAHRRSAWKFSRGEESWLHDYNVTPDVRVYRELWRHSHSKLVGGIPLLMTRDVVKKLREGANSDELEAYLDEVGYGDEPGTYFGMVARDAYKAFHKGDPPSPEQPSLE